MMGNDPNLKPTAVFNADVSTEDHLAEEVRIAAVQEELEVGVATTETGAVRIHKVVHEQVHPAAVNLRSQTVEIKRFAVNQPVEHKFSARQEGARSSSRYSSMFRSYYAADIKGRGGCNNKRIDTRGFSERTAQ